MADITKRPPTLAEQAKNKKREDTLMYLQRQRFGGSVKEDASKRPELKKDIVAEAVRKKQPIRSSVTGMPVIQQPVRNNMVGQVRDVLGASVKTASKTLLERPQVTPIAPGQSVNAQLPGRDALWRQEAVTAPKLAQRMPLKPVADQAEVGGIVANAANRADREKRVWSIPGVVSVYHKRDNDADAALGAELDNLQGGGVITKEQRAGIESAANGGDYDSAFDSVYKAYDAQTPAAQAQPQGPAQPATTAQPAQPAAPAAANTPEEHQQRAAELKASIPNLQGAEKEKAVADWKTEFLAGMGASPVTEEDVSAARARMDEAERGMTFGDSDVDLTEVRASGVISMVEDGEIPLTPEARAAFDAKLEDWRQGRCSQEDVKQVVLDNLGTGDMKEAEEAASRIEAQKRAYDYFAPGVEAFAAQMGQPIDDRVNENEQNDTYRIVNHLGTGRGALAPNAEFGQQTDEYWMTDEQRAYYNTIYNTQGIKAANEFAEKTAWMSAASHAQHDTERYQKMIEEGGVPAVIAQNLGAVLSFVGEVPAAVNTAAKVITGRYVDTNTSAYASNRFRGTTRSATYERIVGDGTSAGRKLGGTVYNLINSTADAASMMALNMIGVPSALTGSVYFASEFNDSFADAKARGADDAKALVYGTGKGIIGALSEQYSIDRIINLGGYAGKAGKEAAVQLIKNAGLGGLTEASEESVEFLGGKLWDAVMMGESSETKLRIKDYEAQGMTHEQARMKALGDDFGTLLQSAGGGAFSGFLLGMGSGVLNMKAEQRTAQQTEVANSMMTMLGVDPASETAEQDAQAAAGRVGAAVASGNPDAQAAVTVLMSGNAITAEQAQGILEAAPEVLEGFGYDTTGGAESIAQQVNDRIEAIGGEGNPLAQASEQSAQEVAETIERNRVANDSEGINQKRGAESEETVEAEDIKADDPLNVRGPQEELTEEELQGAPEQQTETAPEQQEQPAPENKDGLVRPELNQPYTTTNPNGNKVTFTPLPGPEAQKAETRTEQRTLRQQAQDRAQQRAEDEAELRAMQAAEQEEDALMRSDHGQGNDESQQRAADEAELHEEQRAESRKNYADKMHRQENEAAEKTENEQAEQVREQDRARARYDIEQKIKRGEDISEDIHDIRENGTREQMEGTAQAAAETMTDEQMDDILTPMKDAGLWQTKDISRMLDSVSKGSPELRQRLFQLIEKPFNEASGQYGREKTRRQKEIGETLKSIGIKTREDSAILQRYGEGCYQCEATVKMKMVGEDRFEVDSLDALGHEFTGTLTEEELRHRFGANAEYMIDAATRDGNEREFHTSTAPYTEEMMIDEVGIQRADQFRKADEYCRKVYDDYHDRISTMIERVYPNVYEQHEQTVSGMKRAVQKAEQRVKAQETMIDDMRANYEQLRDDVHNHKPGTRARRDAELRVTRAQDDIAAAQAEYRILLSKHVVQQQKLDALELAYKNGDVIRNKRLPKRANYYKHFVEESGGFFNNLRRVLNENSHIDPAVAQISEQTKPKTKWASLMQKRKGETHTDDAYNGLMRYIGEAEYILAFDPLIAQMRTLDSSLTSRAHTLNEEGGGAGGSNSFLIWLNEWTNSLCGKSNQLDRALFKSDRGRKIVKVIQLWNSQVVQNTLLGNVRSASVQISNMTNSLTFVQNPKYWAQAFYSMAHRNTDGALEAIFERSNFLSRRFSQDERMQTAKEQRKEKAAAMLGVLDNVSSEATWWAAYYQFKDKNGNVGDNNKFREYESAEDYADDVTRRTHGGRGEGELPNIMTSKAVNFVAPFQVEIQNTFSNFKQKIGKGDIKGLAAAEAGIWAINTVSQAVFGDRVLGFDFINALIESVCGFFDDEEDKKIQNTVQQFGGQIVGGLPYADTFANFFLDEDTQEGLFGDSAPSRYGSSGTMATNAFSSIVGLFIKGAKALSDPDVKLDKWDVIDVAKYMLPYGGNQLVRSAKGIESMVKGYGENAKGKVQYPTGESYGDSRLGRVIEWTQAGLFGKWATPAAQKYLGNYDHLQQAVNPQGDFTILGETDSDLYKTWIKAGKSGTEFFRIHAGLKGAGNQDGKVSWLKSNYKPEEAAELYIEFGVGTSKYGLKAEGGKVMSKDAKGKWSVKADFTGEGAEEKIPAPEQPDARTAAVNPPAPEVPAPEAPAEAPAQAEPAQPAGGDLASLGKSKKGKSYADARKAAAPMGEEPMSDEQFMNIASATHAGNDAGGPDTKAAAIEACKAAKLSPAMAEWFITACGWGWTTADKNKYSA